MRSFFISFFKAFDVIRKIIINLVFWGIIAALIIVAVKNQYVPEVREGTIIYLDISGFITEHSESVYNSFPGVSAGRGGDTSLRDLLKAINSAAQDRKVTAIILDLRKMRGAGLVKLKEAGRALEKAGRAGKKIIAFSGIYTQGMYYLASHADTIIIDPMGAVFFTGLGSWRSYYSRGFDRFGIEMNIFRSGTGKDAVEPYFLEGMSDNARESAAEILDFLWKEYRNGIISARSAVISRTMESDSAASQKQWIENFNRYINNYQELLADKKGDSSLLAVESGIADKQGFYEDVKKEAGEGTILGWRKYLAAVEKKEKTKGDKIAVIPLSGTIMPGRMPPGMAGGDTFSSLLKDAGSDSTIKAVVLRIDSGGGSVFASEQIRRAVESLRGSSMPVVVSMSSAAASGGYWIALESDEIWCMPSTVTGSIGVFAVFPDLSRFLEKYPGITTDGYGTTPYSNIYRPDMRMSEEMKKIIQLGVDKNNNDFRKLVNDSRDIDVSRIGKVYSGSAVTGEEAVKLGLADKTGYLDEAIASAAAMAGLEEYSIVYLDPKDDFLSWLAGELSSLSFIPKEMLESRLAGTAAGNMYKSLMADLENAAGFPYSPVIYSQYSFDPVIY